MFEKRIYTMLTGMDLEQKVKAKKVFVDIAQDYFDEIGRGLYWATKKELYLLLQLPLVRSKKF